ncbi:transposase family protein [Rhodococcus jostii]|uniref:transposase family protein n=1 Tax=Rhodococcus jostii TaxID=132919 RepID=UPI000932BD39
MKGSYTPHPEDLDVLDDTFTRLDELGLDDVGQRLEFDHRAVLACRVVDTNDADSWCQRCGCEGTVRDSVVRRLAHEPLGWRTTTVLVSVRRYRCDGCGHVWRQDTSREAEPRAKFSRRVLRWTLEALVVQHLTVARVAEWLGFPGTPSTTLCRPKARAC